MARHDPQALIHRVGRRGGILLCLAIVDIGYGGSLIGPSAETLGSAATIWREHYAPLWAWGGAWLLVAAILIVSAFLHRDMIGYAAAIGWKILWSLTTLASWVIGGVDRGWVGTIIWAVAGGMAAICAGWAEPPRAKGNG